MNAHPHLSEQFVNSILSKIDITEIIGDVVKLKKHGKNFTGICPFHSEKSPSFSVNPDEQLFHCFGCGTSGDAISFVNLYYKLNFIDSVKKLADSVGVQLPVNHQQNKDIDNLKPLYLQNKNAGQQFAQQLRTDANRQVCIDYLKSRGISGETALFYNLGYSTTDWRSINGDQELLLSLGLIKEKNNKYYDFFRNRLMFPIRDPKGSVIGFGGRTLEDKKPKYLNSSESELFKKGHTIYGLFEILQKTKSPDYLLVTEGYMDVISLYEHGITQSVATLGTATTEAHIKTLFRYSPRLIFCFDGDDAGQKAAWKAVQSALPFVGSQKTISLILLPDHQDPDDYVKNKGSDALRGLIKSPLTLSAFFFDYLMKSHGLTSIEGKTKLVDEAKPLIDTIQSEAFRSLMLKKLEELTGYAVALPKKQTQLVAAKKTATQTPSSLSIIDFIILYALHDRSLFKRLPAHFFDGQADRKDNKLLELMTQLFLDSSTNAANVEQKITDESLKAHLLFLLETKFKINDQATIVENFDQLVNRAIDQINKDKLSWLIEKSKSELLSDDEKELLLKLLV